MGERHFAGFEYRGLNNLGDYIQSIAVERLLPAIEQRFDRDTLAYANPVVPMSIVMNGWFSHHPQTCLPLSDKLTPLFWGFHITDYNDSWSYFSRKEIVNYLKRYEPIGCRDPYTADRLSQLGVKTFVSYCLTLTLPKREYQENCDKVIVVDGEGIPLPAELEEQAVYYTHVIPGKNREAIKRAYARLMLNMYRTEARLVVTTRLHCLLPCVAMGIPVVFFNNPDNYRTSWVRNIGVEIHTLQDIGRVDWNPTPIDMEKQKEQLISGFQYMQERVATF